MKNLVITANIPLKRFVGPANPTGQLNGIKNNDW